LNGPDLRRYQRLELQVRMCQWCCDRWVLSTSVNRGLHVMHAITKSLIGLVSRHLTAATMRSCLSTRSFCCTASAFTPSSSSGSSSPARNPHTHTHTHRVCGRAEMEDLREGRTLPEAPLVDVSRLWVGLELAKKLIKLVTHNLHSSGRQAKEGVHAFAYKFLACASGLVGHSPCFPHHLASRVSPFSVPLASS